MTYYLSPESVFQSSTDQLDYTVHHFNLNHRETKLHSQNLFYAIFEPRLICMSAAPRHPTCDENTVSRTQKNYDELDVQENA